MQECRKVGKSMKLRVNEEIYQKIMYIVNKAAPNEVSGFCISRKEDPFRVVDFKMVPQRNGGAESAMDDKGLSDYAEEMVVAGYEPVEYQRIWLHSHPFSTTKPSPSGTDWDTLKNIMGGHWGIMVIVPKSGPNWTIKIRCNIEIVPGMIYTYTEDMELVEERRKIESAGWDEEYDKNIIKPSPLVKRNYIGYQGYGNSFYDSESYYPYGQNEYKGNTIRKVDTNEFIVPIEYQDEVIANGQKIKDKGLTMQQYVNMRMEGFTPEDIMKAEVLDKEERSEFYLEWKANIKEIVQSGTTADEYMKLRKMGFAKEDIIAGKVSKKVRKKVSAAINKLFR